MKDTFEFPKPKYGRYTIKEITEIVRKMHEGHFRRDRVTPYFNHLERVANNFEVDDNTSPSDLNYIRHFAALLHDSLEDGKISKHNLMMISHYLPEGVFEIVQLMTKDKYDDYLDYIRNIKQNSLAKDVKIADILDNLSDDPTNKQIIKYAKALLILMNEAE